MSSDATNQHINVILVDDGQVKLADTLAETADDVGVGILIKTVGDYDISILKLPNVDESFDKIASLNPDVLVWVCDLDEGAAYRMMELLDKAIPAMGTIFIAINDGQDLSASEHPVLELPVDPVELYDAIIHVYAQHESTRAERAATRASNISKEVPPVASAHTIAVYSAGAAAGTTTIAINTAVSLAQKGHRTLLIDCDIPYSDVGAMLNTRASASFMHLINEQGTAVTNMEVYDAVIKSTKYGVDLLLPPKRLNKTLELLLRYPDLIPEIIYRIEHRYDYIILDMSSTLNPLVANLLDTAQRILLVTLPTLTSIGNTRKVLQVFEESGFDREKIQVVVNKIVGEPPVELAYLTLDRIERFLGEQSIHAVIPKVEEAFILQAITQGEPLVTSTFEETMPVVKAITQLVEQLEQQPES